MTVVAIVLLVGACRDETPTESLNHNLSRSDGLLLPIPVGSVNDKVLQGRAPLEPLKDFEPSDEMGQESSDEPQDAKLSLKELIAAMGAKMTLGGWGSTLLPSGDAADETRPDMGAMLRNLMTPPDAGDDQADQ